LSPATIQGWLAVVGGLLTVLLGLFKYFNHQSKRELRAAAGASFALTIDALASDNDTSRMAGAVLLRRFFDRHTEQGDAGAPYVKEAIEVMAGMLRTEQTPRVQKVLADGLRYALDLRGADLQNCDLRNAYIGRKTGDERAADLSAADFYGSQCDGASFREVHANKAVFYNAGLEKAVFVDADCREADFRAAKLAGARFAGAQIGGAEFAGAESIPQEVAILLDESQVGHPGAVVAKPAGSR
jgi:Pentapeptide repeats (9 copies)/Pentapeptide repeats (8 copies)